MKSHVIVGVIIILLGLSILFSFPIINFIFAFLILWLGVKIISGQGSSFRGFSQTKGTLHDDYLRRVLIFSGINADLKNNNVEGIDIVSIFGGGEINATGSKTSNKDIEVNLVSIFGGIKLIVPKDWKVRSEGVGIIGGFDDHTTPSSKNVTTVHLKGVAIFGGVEIVN